MDLGQRIKAARLEKGLSQRQLCGDVITRNMLSQIENGSARPSMDTLSYLAKQLDKPMSFFLEEHAVVSVNQPVMEQVRRFFAAGDYQQVRSLLGSYREQDATFDWEKALLLAQSDLALARQALQENRLPYVQRLLEEAALEGAKTPYYTEETESMRQLLLWKAGSRAQLPDVDGVLLCRAEEALAQNNLEKAGACLDACEAASGQWQLLRGKVFLGQGQYAQAIDCLKAAEENGSPEAIALLERCYSATEDYKMAYLYACKQKGGTP